MVMPSPIGPLLMEASPLGMMRIAFLTEAEAAALPPLSLGLQQNSTGSSIVIAAASQLGAYFAGKRRTFDLPLDLQGTPFQRQVWRKLLKISFGEVRSYPWLAAEAGVENDDQAVAEANRCNPIPIIVPCHRVIPADSGEGGYSGGAERKRFLLTLERAAAGA
ncbi:MAG: methylated-DNA--[protein]-cysteine S-methyltransferase [Candidatus Sericytochromatia bacterium]|nr:methylated-DNA--[protein]-cysteine S-methyltransferase [Candidatus Sericytochromatia bacterium]